MFLRQFAAWNTVLLQSKQFIAHYRFVFLPRYEIKNAVYSTSHHLYHISLFIKTHTNKAGEYYPLFVDNRLLTSRKQKSGLV